MKRLTVSELLDLTHSISRSLLEGVEYPWEALPRIKEYILELGPTLPTEDYDSPCDGVWIAKSARVAPSARICPPCIIGKDAEVRHCAYIRGSVIVGENAVIGNSCELKNSIIFDSAQIPHFNYVGDSIIGYRAHMGAGAITSNVKSDKTKVTLLLDRNKIATDLKKMGAILGDRVEIGCNCVLNPGTVIGKDTNVYPLSSVRGYIPQGHIFKSRQFIIKKEERKE